LDQNEIAWQLWHFTEVFSACHPRLSPTCAQGCGKIILFRRRFPAPAEAENRTAERTDKRLLRGSTPPLHHRQDKPAFAAP
jgi:hypothetical protein